MNTAIKFLIISVCVLLKYSCYNKGEHKVKTAIKSPVIFDTDANNELDDQHALAYLLLRRKRKI